MSQPGDPVDRNRGLRSFNLALAAVAGQVGCLTIAIIFLALLAGRWLDGRFNSSPLFTIVLMAGSVPVTLVLMFWVVKSVTARYMKTPDQGSKEIEEGSGSGKTS
jgi:hypothetical protein